MSFSGALLSSGQTSAILNAFATFPSTGSIQVPGALVGEADLVSVPLTSKNAPSLVSSVERLIQESRELEQRVDAWGLTNRTPLLGTDHQWSIAAYPAAHIHAFDEVVLGEDPEGLVLSGPHSRRIRFNRLAEGLELSVGFDGPLAKAIQTIYIDSAYRVWTGSYHFDFLGQAMQGLRQYLELDSEAPLTEVAERLIPRVAAWSQFRDTPIGEISPAAGEKLDTFSRSSEATVRTTGRSGHPEPALQISGEPRESGYLSLTMRWDVHRELQDKSGLVRLTHDSLRLWGGASMWALHEPSLEDRILRIVGDEIERQVIARTGQAVSELGVSLNRTIANDIRELAAPIIEGLLKSE